jgi:hypothetical protein
VGLDGSDLGARCADLGISISITERRTPRILLLVSLPLQKLSLLVLAHLLAALLDDTTHSVFSLLDD